MPVKRQRPGLKLPDEQRGRLAVVSRSRSDEQRRVERAQILLAYAEGESIAAIVRRPGTYRRKVERLVDKALELGPLAALDDLKRRGRPPTITSEARAWLLASACEKPKDLGYSYELWTNELLARHAREHCREAGHPSLARLSRGTVSKILNRNDLRPHKVRYYLERRDPEFDRKMVEVLHVYREVEVIREQGGDPAASTTAYLSYDEKPGIQALGTTSGDLPPVPGTFDRIYRDFGSWLNLIECFFARMAKTVLRGIRVASKEELAARIRLFLSEVNRTPVQYRWKYGLDELPWHDTTLFRNRTSS